MGQLKQSLLQAEYQERTARAALNILMGREESSPLAVAGSLPVEKAKKIEINPFLDGASEHPQARGARYAAEGARADSLSESRSIWPRLAGFSQVEGDGDRMDRGGWNYMAGLRVQMPFFDPSYGSRVNLKKAAAKESEAVGKIANHRIRMRVHQEFNLYSAAAERLPLGVDSAAEAKNALDMFKKLYRSGRQSIADLMQGEMMLVQARSGLDQTYFDLRAGYARLLWASGQLETLPEELQ